MTGHFFRKTGVLAGLLLVLTLGLFSDGFLAQFDNPVGSLLREALAIFHSSEMQWMVFSCAVVYFFVFALLRSRQTLQESRMETAHDLWLTGTLLVGTFVYVIDYSTSANSTQALTLLTGAALGQGVALWAAWQQRSIMGSVDQIVVSVVVLLLFGASLWWGNYAGQVYQYHGQARWSGPWENPNIYGLLMGLGLVLAVGLFVKSIISAALGRRVLRWQTRLGDGLKLTCMAIVACLVARGLLKSYSRGAWVSVICAMAYACFQIGRYLNVENASLYQWLRRNFIPLITILASLLLFAFWQFRLTEGAAARRAASVGSANDLSRHNRIAAWEGDLQMMAEHPWFGASWNQPEPYYEHYYSSSRLDDAMGIQMNDYLLLGATLGVPALFCFCMYLWLALAAKLEIGNWKLEMAELGWLKTVCRAGALVLAVGFWFDGGLFKLPTAATFWILLELGREV